MRDGLRGLSEETGGGFRKILSATYFVGRREYVGTEALSMSDRGEDPSPLLGLGAYLFPTACPGTSTHLPSVFSCLQKDMIASFPLMQEMSFPGASDV